MRVPPPSARSTTTWPPWVSATWRDDREAEAGARLAASRAGAVEAVEDEGQVLFVDSGAVVAHGDLAVADADLDLAARRAPLRGVVEQVRDGALDRRGAPVDERLLEVRRECDAGPVATGTLDRVCGDQVEPHVLGLLRLRTVFTRELDQLADQRGHLADLLDHVGQELLTLRLRQLVLACEDSMFVRRLVSGVRSSCEASATSCRWARLESSSAASMVLKLVGEPAELVLAGRLDALGEISVSVTRSWSRSADGPA